MDIKGLREMSETERILWFAKATANDLTIVLENEDIECYSNTKKSEKLAMVIDLLNEEIYDIMEETRQLYTEIVMRQSYEEKIEWTFYCRYKNNEITYDQLRKVCDKYKLDIPLSCNEQNSVDFIDKFCDFYSHYQHYNKEGRKYYSVLDESYEWRNVFRNDGKHKWNNWEEKQLYERNTVDKNGRQLSFSFDSDGDCVISVYKNYKLLGTFDIDCCVRDIKMLIGYDYRLFSKDSEIYTELLERLNKQREEYNKNIEADRMLLKKLNGRYNEFSSSIIKETPKRCI